MDGKKVSKDETRQIFIGPSPAKPRGRKKLGPFRDPDPDLGDLDLNLNHNLLDPGTFHLAGLL